MAFLFGMKAAEIKKRYDLSIDVDDPEKHNDHYLHIQILPKTQGRHAGVQRRPSWSCGRTTRTRSSPTSGCCPARLWFQHPNGDQITGSSRTMTTQTKLLPADFKAPGFPDKEWKSEWVKPPARIVPAGRSTGWKSADEVTYGEHDDVGRATDTA